MSASRPTGGLIAALISDVAVPEILRAVQAHYADTGTVPTLDELRARLASDADRVIATGEAYLAAHEAAPR